MLSLGATSWRLITAHTLLFTGSTQQRSLRQTTRPSTTKTQEIGFPQYPWQHLKHLCILLKVFHTRPPGSVCASSAYIILRARVWFKREFKLINVCGMLTSSPSLSSSTELHCPGGESGEGTAGVTGQLRQSLSRTSLTPFLSLSWWQGRFLDSQTASWVEADGWKTPTCPETDSRRITHLFNQSKLLVHLGQRSEPVRSKCIDFLWRDSKQSSVLLCQHHKRKDSSRGFSTSLLCDVPTPCCAVQPQICCCVFCFFMDYCYII